MNNNNISDLLEGNPLKKKSPKDCLRKKPYNPPLENQIYNFEGKLKDLKEEIRDLKRIVQELL